MRRTAALVIVLVLVVAAAAYAGFDEYQSYNSPAAICQREADDTELGFISVMPAIHVQNGTNTGVLTVEVGGSACSPIVGFMITSIHPVVSGVVNASFVEYQGIPISKTNPELIDQPALGSIPVSNVTAGQRYSIVYNVALQSGGSGPSGNITFTATAYTPLNSSLDQNLTAAVNYLVSSYNPKLGLLPETPGSSTYWLCSDNYLATLALSRYGGSNLTIAHTAANVSETLVRYLPPAKSDNQYTTIESGACEYPAASNYTIPAVDGDQIMTTSPSWTLSASTTKAIPLGQWPSTMKASGFSMAPASWTCPTPSQDHSITSTRRTSSPCTSTPA